MKTKPKGAKYRNLVARGGVIYYSRKIAGKRERFSTQTDDWAVAAQARDDYEARKGVAARFLSAEAPRLVGFAARYLKEDTSHLAATTRRDRALTLKAQGRILGPLGEHRLDEITPPVLRAWWNAEVTARGVTVSTGRAYLDALSGVLRYAQELGLLDVNPVSAFRETLRHRTRTQRGRAEATPGGKVHPIEDPAAIARLVAEARAEGLVAATFVLLLLDGGLRVGEALGLKWGALAWGSDAGDRSRSLRIDCNKPRGGAEGPPKSGRARTVALSYRLRETLLDLCVARFEPGPETLVLDGLNDRNFYHREWRRILKRAGIGHRALKDLRDTFASQLLTAGVQLGYISQQLGHADVGVTARHYAKWTGGAFYRVPMRLEPGEVPADFLARLVAEGPQKGHTSDSGGGLVRETPSDYGEILERETGFEPATLTLAT